MHHSPDPHVTLALEWAADLPYPAEADEIIHRVEVLRTRSIRRAKRRARSRPRFSTPIAHRTELGENLNQILVLSLTESHPQIVASVQVMVAAGWSDAQISDEIGPDLLAQPLFAAAIQAVIHQSRS